MEVTSGKIACGASGILIGLFFALYVGTPHPAAPASVVPVATATTTTAATTTATPSANKPEVIDAVYPLYTNNISWSLKVPVTLPPLSDYNPTSQSIVGYQVSSLPTAMTTDISSIFEPFRNYYDHMLLGYGWRIDPMYEADGAGGSLWGYTKGSNILVFSYTSTFLNQAPNRPSQCPCTIVFTIIGGTLK